MTTAEIKNHHSKENLNISRNWNIYNEEILFYNHNFKKMF